MDPDLVAWKTDPVFGMTLSQQKCDYPWILSLRTWYHDVFWTIRSPRSCRDSVYAKAGSVFTRLDLCPRSLSTDSVNIYLTPERALLSFARSLSEGRVRPGIHPFLHPQQPPRPVVETVRDLEQQRTDEMRPRGVHVALDHRAAPYRPFVKEAPQDRKASLPGLTLGVGETLVTWRGRKVLFSGLRRKLTRRKRNKTVSGFAIKLRRFGAPKRS